MSDKWYHFKLFFCYTPWTNFEIKNLKIEFTSEISTSKIQSNDGVGKSIPLVDGHSVGDTVSGVHDYASGSSRGVQRQHCLDIDVHGWTVERLEHDLGHLFPVGLGVEGGLGQQHWVLLGGYSQLVVEGMVPDLFHVVPVGDDSVFDGVLQGEDTPLALGLVSHVGVLLTHSHHHSLMTGTSHNGGEHGSGGIVTFEYDRKIK